MEVFLEDKDGIPWQLPTGVSVAWRPDELYVGPGDRGLNVAVAEADRRPKVEDLRRVWAKRENKTGIPLLLVVAYPHDGYTRVAICGPTGERPRVVLDIDPDQARRICDAALDRPDRHAALRFLAVADAEEQQELPGIRNSGMLATHELIVGVPQRDDWQSAVGVGSKLLRRAGRELVRGLGFAIEPLGVDSSVLVAGGTKRAVAVFLEEGEEFEDPAGRLQAESPVEHALSVADREGLPWVVLVRDADLRLYSSKPDVGVGRKGRAATFVEANLALLPSDNAGYLPLIFGADALVPGGTLDEIMRDSADFAADLGARLRDRVYFRAVPAVAEALAARLGDALTEDDLDAAYDQTMVVLFRLLFVAYAEDKELLPYRSNGLYADHSLKHLARELTEQLRADAPFDENATDLWDTVTTLWTAVDKGRDDWDVPQYNGGMFSTDADINSSGAALGAVRLTNVEFGPALAALLVDEGVDGTLGPVDFRTLSVREFGTIYEGLLESELSIAVTDLTIDKRGSYVPAKRGDEIYAEEGTVYFHNRSGIRKSSGTYFTKPFAVEHLLRTALDRGLERHAARVNGLLDAGDDAGAAAAFFDFRCVDLAMGSGHFLVAAVDHIEARLSRLLTEHPIPLVRKEIDTLRRAARSALGDLADRYPDESTQILRRLIARRCIYGVDLNPISVELARLSIWIHTFVPGLPLSFLDHNLVPGNALTGIGSVEEAVEIIDPGTPGKRSLFLQPLLDQIDAARPALQRLATINDATVEDVDAARAAADEIYESLDPVQTMFDLLVVARAGLGDYDAQAAGDAVRAAELWETEDVQWALGALDPLHFPTAFPEVFIRDRPGFDCILGNPPWEEATVEELSFFALRYPGLKGFKGKAQKDELARIRRARPDLVEEYEFAVGQAETLRATLLAGPYPGMGTGDPDLYKAFCWRFWQLCAMDGDVGVVLPRTALSASGSAPWRLAILDEGAFTDVTILYNANYWVFDDMDNRKAVGLVGLSRTGSAADAVTLRGPFTTLAHYQRALQTEAFDVPVDGLRSWSQGAALPLIPGRSAGEVFLKLRAHPRLDDPTGEWLARPATEFHATSDKHRFDLDLDHRPKGWWPVFKGESFNIWEPDTGKYYGWIDPDEAVETLQAKRRAGLLKKNSVFRGMDEQWATKVSTLPCKHPRLAFRDITNRTNQRTVIAALIPGNLVMTNQAPYLLWPRGDESDQAYLLGVLASLPLDWYARRIVETHVNFFILNSFPIPRPESTDRRRLRIIEVAGRLATPDKRFERWAEAVGVEAGSVADEAERDALVAELDAVVAHLYGLTADDLRVIFETFHTGWEPTARIEATLEQHAAWSGRT